MDLEIVIALQKALLIAKNEVEDLSEGIEAMINAVTVVRADMQKEADRTE